MSHSTADAFFPSKREALEEAIRRRADPVFKEFMTRVEESPYRGFRVRSIPADLVLDQIADGGMMAFQSPRHLFGT